MNLLTLAYVNAFNGCGDYMYFDHWKNDSYNLSADTQYGLNSLGCSTFQFS